MTLAPTTNPMKGNITFRLSLMMFLQFFIWGSWFTSIAVYMANEGMGTLTHWPYTVNPIAAIIAPFFLGLIADRFFPTEKVLGVLHILGALIMFLVPQTTGTPALFIVLLLAYNLCYMPTLGLANIGFGQLTRISQYSEPGETIPRNTCIRDNRMDYCRLDYQ